MSALLLISLFVASAAGGAVLPTADPVLDLDGKNLDVWLLSHPLALIQFYAPAHTCQYCQDFEPVFSSVAAQIATLNSSVAAVKVDALSAPGLENRFSIASYPSLRWLIAGNEEASLDVSDESEESIARWARKLASNPVMKVDSQAELSRTTGRELAMVGFFEQYEGDEHDAFQKLAFEEEADFVKTTNKELAAALGISTAPGFAVVRNYPGHEPATVLFTRQEASPGEQPFFEDLEAFFYRERLPNWLEYDMERFGDLLKQIGSVPINYHIYVVAPPEQLQRTSPIMAAVHAAGQQLRGRALVLVHRLQPEVDTPLISYMQVDPSAGHPQVVGAEIVKALKYRAAASEVTAESLVTFMEAVAAGTAERVLTSANVPELPMDSDNVTVIVGSTLETIARDPTKDVLLKVYAPWCPHCQALAPVYSRLATALQGVPSLVVAKVDKDENEHRDLDQVEGLPTLLFYPAGETGDPVWVPLEGDVTVEMLLAFLEANVQVKFKPPHPRSWPPEISSAEEEDEDDEYGDETEDADGEQLGDLNADQAAPGHDEL